MVSTDMRAYRVGGFVRDHLLGVPPPDRDWVVVGEHPKTMLARGFRQVGADFPVFIHPTSGEEYALARRERKTGHGYHGFTTESSVDVTLEQDLSRRDLTINAMAMDAAGVLIDPHGGQRDLEKRLLRHVSDAFRDDPLRILRVARFQARFANLGFRIAPETLGLMDKITTSGELSHLTPERIWLETRKALETEKPSHFFTVLARCGALAVIFPELAALQGQIQPRRYHPEGDAWEHSLLVLEWAAALSVLPPWSTISARAPPHQKCYPATMATKSAGYHRWKIYVNDFEYQKTIKNWHDAPSVTIYSVTDCRKCAPNE